MEQSHNPPTKCDQNALPCRRPPSLQLYSPHHTWVAWNKAWLLAVLQTSNSKGCPSTSCIYLDIYPIMIVKSPSRRMWSALRISFAYLILSHAPQFCSEDRDII
ncbi:hypothetical protein COCNU_contig69246822G000010 [Cocos nucifera]|nr:hypothetical protein [Cocos nucifera]